MSKKKNKAKGFTLVGDVIKKFDNQEDKYISHEFQKYGYEFAKELGDLKNKSLYIKFAKEFGLGENDFSKIEVVGSTVEECKTRFKPHSRYKSQRSWIGSTSLPSPLRK